MPIRTILHDEFTQGSGNELGSLQVSGSVWSCFISLGLWVIVESSCFLLNVCVNTPQQAFFTSSF